jgi:RHS repeat-associated protein
VSSTTTGTETLVSIEVIFLIGGPGDNRLDASQSTVPVVLIGNAGDDVLGGGLANDTIDGGDGNDSIFGSDGDDSIEGGQGNDEISSGAGNDTAGGGDGDDVVIGGEGDDQVDGGTGTDIVAGRGCGLADDGADSVADGVLEMNVNACREQRDLEFENRVPEFTSTIEAAINPSVGMGADRQNMLLATGEYLTGAVDLTVPGRGLDFVFARTYRSGLLFNGVLGRGWDHNYNYRLVETTADSLSHVQQTFPGAVFGDVARMDGSGRADLYTRNMDGSYTAPSGYFTRLTRNMDGSFTERFADGTRMEFLAADGADLCRLSMIVDRFDNTVELEYADGQLTRVRDVYDRSYDFSYDQAGRLDQLTDFDGRSVTYQYDTSGNLLGATSPVITGTSTGNDFAGGRTWQYSYSSGQAARSENHNLLTVTAPNEVATGGSSRVALTYDAADRVISQSLGGTNASTVPSGGVWSYSYASLSAPAPGNPNLVVDQTTVTDGNGNETEYRFNTLGNTLRAEEFTNRNLRSTDPASFVVTYAYNGDGQRLSSTLPEGNSFQWTFDSANADRLQQGNLLSETRIADIDRGGDQVQLTTTWTYEPIFNQVRTATDPRGNDAGYVPQNGGSQSAVRYTGTNSFDYEEAFDLNAIGNRIGLTMAEVQTLFTAAGISTTPRGDLNGDADTSQHSGHAVRMDAPSVTLLTGSNQALAEGDTTQDVMTLTRFNDFGQIVSVTDPEENVHTYQYYGADDPDGDALDLIAGNDTSTGGYLEQTTLDTATAPGRNSGSDPAPANIRMLNFYDDRGNATRIVNGRGIATDYEYNQLNELVQVTRAAAHDVFAPSPAEPVSLDDFAYLERFFYDHNGNLVLSQREDRGNTSNVDGNPMASDLPAVAPDPDPVGGTAFVDTVIKYDILNRPIEMVQEVENGGTEFLHTQMRYDANGNQVLTIQPEGNAIASVFDERELLFNGINGALTPPSAALLSATDPTDYDVRGGLASVNSFRFDGNRNLVETGDADDTDGSTDNNSSLGSGDRTRMLYDGFDRLTSIVDSVGNQMVRQYDPASNTIRDMSFGPVGGNSPTADGPATLLGPVSSNGQVQSGNLVNSNLLSVTEISLDEQSRVFQTDQVLFVNTIATQRTPDVNDGATDLGEGDLTPGDDQAIPGVAGVTILGRVSMQMDHDRNGRPTFVRGDDTKTQQTLYDGVDRAIHMIDPEGNQLRMAYDDAGNVIETATTEVSQAMDVLDEVFLETNFFDSLDRPVRRVDNIGQTTESRFNSRGNLVAQTDARGPATGFLTTITRRAFAAGTLTDNTINGFGNVTTFQYDGLSRPVQSELVMTASGDGDGANIGATTEGIPSTRPTADTTQGGGDGLIRYRTLYDGNSLNVARIDDQGNVTVNLFDNQDRLVVETFGVTVSTTLDNSTLLGSRTVPTPTAATVNNPAVISTTLIDTQLAGTKARINAVSGSFPAGADQIDATTSVVYGLDPEGNQRILEDQNDTETFTAFDALGRPIAARCFRAGQSDSHSGDSLFAPVPASDPSNSSGGLPTIVGTTVQDFQYDGLSRSTRMTDNNDPLDASDDSIATRAYDSLSRVIEETQQVGALSPRAVSTSWRAEHLPSAVVYPNGREVERLFDGLDRAVSSADAAPPAPVSSGPELSSHDNPLAEISYVGPCCRLVSIGFGNGTGMDTRASSDFDDFQQLINDYSGAISVVLDQTLGSFAAGSVISLDRIEGGSIAPPDSCATVHLHSSGGITIDGEGPFSDPNPPVCGFGQVVASGFDGDRRAITMVHRDGDGNVIVGFDNVYDSNGNRLVDNKRHQPTDSHVSGFDSANRLIAFDRGTINSSRDGIQTPSSRQPLHSLWDLDGAGNWNEVTSGAGVTETREHSNFNEITSRSDGTTTNTASDDNGNQTDDGTFTFQHDAHNRIVRVTRKADGLVVAEYDYDAIGRRIRRVVGNSGPLNGTTVYYYDEWQAVEERDGADVLARQFVFGEGLDQVLLKDENLDGDDSATGAGDRRLFYHADSDGSIHALTDSTGKVVEGYLYDAFGRTTVFSPGPNGVVDFGGDDGIVVEGAGGENNPFMFTGRRFDAETGKFYFRHRYFDPNEGRFVTRDPLGGASHQSFYSYDGRDPMGLDPVTAGKITVASRSASGTTKSPVTPTQVSNLKQDVKDALDTLVKAVKNLDQLEHIKPESGADKIKLRFIKEKPDRLREILNKTIEKIKGGITLEIETGTRDWIDWWCGTPRLKLGTDAYVYDLGWVIHINPSFFTTSLRQQRSTILHELTHLGGSEDEDCHWVEDAHYLESLIPWLAKQQPILPEPRLESSTALITGSTVILGK